MRATSSIQKKTMRIIHIPNKGPVIFHAFRGLPYTPLNTICECCDDFRAELVIFGDRRNKLNFVDEYHVAPCFPDTYFICRECSIKYRCYRPDIDEIEHAVYDAAQKKAKEQRGEVMECGDDQWWSVVMNNDGVWWCVR